jgi:tRNA splicing ligase
MGNRNPAGHISCFNFTRNVFYNRGWTDMNELARSLYINTNDYSIAARAYPKWFRVNETEATKLAQLKKTIQFPAQVYIKENGFLGLVGYDTTMQRPLYATKGSTQGPYVEWFKAAFTDKQRAAVEEYVTNNPYTLIFECIDFAHDPHIVDAADDRAFNVLLDGVKRSVDYEKLSRDELIAFGNKSDLYVKARYRTLETWEHFMSLYDWVQEYAEGDMEGYVIEDAAGFCVKLKTEYYNFWKWMRSVRDTLKARRPLNMKQFDTVRSNQVVAWLKTLTAEELQLSIPELRNKYNNLHP